MGTSVVIVNIACVTFLLRRKRGRLHHGMSLQVYVSKKLPKSLSVTKNMLSANIMKRVPGHNETFSSFEIFDLLQFSVLNSKILENSKIYMYELKK